MDSQDGNGSYSRGRPYSHCVHHRFPHAPRLPFYIHFSYTRRKRTHLEASKDRRWPSSGDKVFWVQLWAAWKDWKVHIRMFIGFLHPVPFAALGLFIPSIVQGFGFDQVTTQIMTVPIYAVACFFTILSAYSTDRHRDVEYTERLQHLWPRSDICCCS